MPRPNKPSDHSKETRQDCALFVHPSEPNAQDANVLLKDTDAAYVITPDTHLYYIIKKNREITVTPFPAVNEDRVKRIILEIHPDFLFGLAYQTETKCLIPSMPQHQLNTLFKETGHVHQKTYVAKFLQSLEQLKGINRFAEAPSLCTDAIDCYRDFLNGLLKDMLTELRINPGSDFYKNYWFTLLSSKGEPIENMANDLTPIIRNNYSAADVQEKLNHAQEIINPFLSTEDARTIIAGVNRLQRIIPLSAATNLLRSDAFNSLGMFNDSLRNSKNSYVDFLIDTIQGAKKLQELKPVVVVPERNNDSISMGKEEDDLIRLLKKECLNYQKHLQRGPLEGSRLSKYNQVQRLIAILDSTDKDKIENFRTHFDTVKSDLVINRDQGTLLFLKNITFFLSSLFLGAGLVYSNMTKGGCNFFNKSHGYYTVRKIEDHLNSREREENHNSPTIQASP